MAVHVSSRQADGGLTLHLTGDFAAQVNHELLASCAEHLLQCAEKNACLQEGLRVTSACVETVARHQDLSRCMTEGLGFAAKR
jgi:hypothetical protein